MIIQRPPALPLRPFVKLFWASDQINTESSTDRERLLPTGNMHVVFRLSDQPIRIFDSVEDCKGRTFGCAVIGGLRSSYYVKDVSQHARNVGAVLYPGAAQFLFGAPADEFAEQHTAVDDLWGRHATDVREQLKEESSLQKQLDLFELFLIKKVPQWHSIHPSVAHALKRFPFIDVVQAVRESGYSHRQFIKLFRTTVGVSPKLYCRILRFQSVLNMLADPESSSVDIALQAEYSDQAHFNREFREFTGISPGEYRSLCRTTAHHVPVPD